LSGRTDFCADEEQTSTSKAAGPVAHPLDFGSSKGADFDFPNIQQTKVFPN